MLNRQIDFTISGRDASKNAFASARKNVDALGTSVSTVTKTARLLQGTFGALTLGFAGTNAIRTLADLQDSLARVSRLSSKPAETLDFLSAASKRLSLDLSGAANNLAELQVLSNSGFISEGQANELFLGFAEAASAVGLGASDVQFAIKGLRQGLSQGTLRAQEFDQIFDSIGFILPDVARNLGYTTTEFQKMRSTGTLLTKDVLEGGILPAFKELEGTAESLAGNLNPTFRRIGTAFKELLRDFETPIGNIIQPVAESTIKSFESLAENAGTVASAISLASQVAALAFAGSIAGRVAAYGSSLALAAEKAKAFSQATKVNELLNVSEATSLLRVAEATKKVAQEDVNRNKRLARRLGLKEAELAADIGIVRSRERLRVANLAVAEASERQLAAVTRLTAASRAGGIAGAAFAKSAKLLSGALSLVGGPIGLVTIAAGAFILKINDANKAQEAFAESSRRLRNAENISDVSSNKLAQDRKILEDAILKDRQLIQDINAKDVSTLKKMNAQLDAFLSGGGVGEENFLAFINQRLKDTEGQLESLNNAEFVLIKSSEVDRVIDDIGRMDNVLAKIGLRKDESADLISKFLPNKAKLAELKLAADDLERLKGVTDPADYAAANAEIVKQINSLNGVTAAQTKVNQAREKALSDVTALTDKVLSESDRLQAEFETNAGKINIAIGYGFDEAEGQQLIQQLLAQANSEIAAIDAAANKKRVDAAIQSANDRLTVEREFFQSKADLLTDAGNSDGLKLQLDLETDALESQFSQYIALGIATEQDLINAKFALNAGYEAQLKELQCRSAESSAALVSSKTEKALNDKLVVGGEGLSLGLDVIQLFKKDASDYIALTESMSDAERSQAIAENIINKKRFEQNKKFAKAQAVISGSIAVLRALELPFPASLLAAGTAAAAAAKQIQQINSSSFGGGSFNSVVDSGSSTSSSSASVSDTNSNGGATTVYFVTQIPSDLEGVLNQDFLYQNQQANFAQMVDDDIISSDAEIVVSTTSLKNLSGTTNGVY